MAAYTSSGERRLLQRLLIRSRQAGLLMRDEEAHQIKRIRAGDAQAKTRMTLANVRFVFCVAREYEGCGLPLCDLVDEGIVGMLGAMDHWDETRGTKFISYAVSWIRQSILIAIYEYGNDIKVPHWQRQLNHIWRNADRLAQQIGRWPTSYENGQMNQLTESVLGRWQRLTEPFLSLDQPVFSGEDKTIGDSVPDRAVDDPETILSNKELSSILTHALDGLTAQEQAVISEYFGLDDQQPLTLGQIGEGQSLTAERIRVIRDKALHKLRRHPGLRDYAWGREFPMDDDSNGNGSGGQLRLATTEPAVILCLLDEHGWTMRQLVNRTKRLCASPDMPTTWSSVLIDFYGLNHRSPMTLKSISANTSALVRIRDRALRYIAEQTDLPADLVKLTLGLSRKNSLAKQEKHLALSA